MFLGRVGFIGFIWRDCLRCLVRLVFAGRTCRGEGRRDGCRLGRGFIDFRILRGWAWVVLNCWFVLIGGRVLELEVDYFAVFVGLEEESEIVHFWIGIIIINNIISYLVGVEWEEFIRVWARKGSGRNGLLFFLLWRVSTFLLWSREWEGLAGCWQVGWMRWTTIWSDWDRRWVVAGGDHW